MSYQEEKLKSHYCGYTIFKAYRRVEIYWFKKGNKRLSSIEGYEPDPDKPRCQKYKSIVAFLEKYKIKKPPYGPTKRELINCPEIVSQL